MKTHSRPRANGFTLVELIVTITIIVLLAGLIVGGFGFVRDKQASATAELQISLLSRGIDEYKLDMGVYPGMEDSGGNSFGGAIAQSEGGNHSEVLYNALFHEGWEYLNANQPDSWPGNKATTIYITELDPHNNNQGWLNPPTGNDPLAGLKILDPWANRYRYRVGGNAMNPDFDLWSTGKDGRTQTALPYNPNHPDNLDDIRNF